MDKIKSFRKLLTPIIISGILIFTGLVLYMTIYAYEREQDYIEEYTQSRMKALIYDIDIKVVSTESVLISESHMYEVTPADSLWFFSSMEEFILDNDFVNNVGIDFWDPMEDDDANAYSTTYYAVRDSVSGKIKHGYKIVPNDIVSAEELDCYNEAAETGKPCWSQPYFDEHFTGKYMTTCYQQCYKEGVMLSADVNICELLRDIDSLKFYADSKMYIKDAEGNVFSLNRDTSTGLILQRLKRVASMATISSKSPHTTRALTLI